MRGNAKVKVMKEIPTIEKSLGHSQRPTGPRFAKGEEWPETKEEEPKISYHIFYAPHVTAKDFENLKNAFDKADIYVPEGERWSFRTKDLLNRLSQGEITPEELAAKEFINSKSAYFKEYEMIYNSKKPILFVDLPFSHELITTSKRNDELGNESLKLFAKGDFEFSFKTMRQHIINEAGYEKKREELIKKNLEEEVKKFIKTDSKLKDKSDVKVLLSLGAVHTGIYHNLKKEKAPVSREFSRQPYIFDSMGQAIREMMFSRRKKPDKLLLARALVESKMFVYYINRRISYDSGKLMLTARKISSHLNFKDVKNISKELGKDSSRTIMDVLEKRGIEIPKTEEEMDEIH